MKTLSEKRAKLCDEFGWDTYCYPDKDVKEFIKDILEIIDKEFNELEKENQGSIAELVYVFKQSIKMKIKKRAGGKLI